jgi:DNA-directed RNA polymerase specialized sigma24 family protein
VATRTWDRRPAAEPDGPQQRVADLVTRKGAVLLRVARQWSLCADDAQDAYQRALEIYIRRIDSLDPATEIAWLKVVKD